MAIKRDIMIKRILFAIWLSSCLATNTFSQSHITISGEVVKGFKQKNFHIEIADPRFPGNVADWKKIKAIVHNKKYNFSFPKSKSLLVALPQLSKKYIDFIYLEAGDNLMIKLEHDRIKYAGKAAAKVQLAEELDSIDKVFKKLHTADYITVKSLKEYFLWNQTQSKRLQSMLDILNSFKYKISNIAYARYKAYIINWSEFEKGTKFSILRNNAKVFGYTSDSLHRIMKSVLDTKEALWLHSYTGAIDDIHGLFMNVQAKALARYNFDLSNPSVDTREKRKLEYYRLAKEIYKGESRKKILYYIIREAFEDLGFKAEVDEILVDYYKTEEDSQFKTWVRNLEKSNRKILPGQSAPDFTLTDEAGKAFQKEQLVGKVTLIDFWFSGCTGCVQTTMALKKVEEVFKDNPKVEFLSVCTDLDKNRWLKSVAEGKYTTGKGMNVYTGGKGNDHDMIRTYQVTSFPRLYLLNELGFIVANPVPDPRMDEGKALIDLIQAEVSKTNVLNDGPYVFNSANGRDQKTINYEKGLPEISSDSVLFAGTDMKSKKFPVVLHNAKASETEYSRADKLLVLSDIEGNFKSLRSLLEQNGVIDTSFNWIFGSGQLVFAGDMFDRGNQVTECLWLLYTLENKAKASGGQVHFVLGNHEILNLQGDHRYTAEKYRNSAKVLNRSLAALYGEDTELGRWLRTKNIVEKVGDILFVHGGISSQINQSSLSLAEINRIARPNYAIKRADYGNALTNLTMSTSDGPFWYRGYYKDPKANEQMVDSILNKYGVKHIVTGHTVIADTITALFNNRVINTDVPHAKGKSEALLIEGNSFYRVNDKGQRFFLFKDPEENPKTKIK